MSLASRLAAAVAGLPPARTHRVHVDADLAATMPDGTVLLADRYYPDDSDGRAPIVLIRSPYGRKNPVGLVARLFAERGYQAVIQSCRGTFGSGGDFYAFRNEASDGRATLEWLAAQPWFSGSVGMWGPSYVGYVQWAVATDGPSYLKALAPSITASDFRPLMYPGGSFSLDTTLSWISTVADQEKPALAALRKNLVRRRTLAKLFARLPLDRLDALATGAAVPHYQDWLVHDSPGDRYWTELNHGRDFGAISAPVDLVGGWYDLFIPTQLADFQSLRAAGVPARITIGPWSHVAPRGMVSSLRSGLEWFDHHLRALPNANAAAPVRVFVMGARRWRHLPDWPPPEARPTRYYLAGSGRLAREPSSSDPDRYRYDPADPTPSVGGVVLGTHAGPRDNRRLEARPDVLIYTSQPLAEPVEVIGRVSAELHVRSSLEHTDFFVRLCDVHPSGRSINVCDGITRLGTGDWVPDPAGVSRVEVELWPTAHRFLPGHRIRVQVASGSHPRFARNPGSGEPLGRATTLKVAEQEVFHDSAHPSAVILPVMP